MLPLVCVELHDICEGRIIGLRMGIHGIEDDVAAPRNRLFTVHCGMIPALERVQFTR